MSVVTRARSTVIGAWLEGWRRVFGAPWLAVGVLAATFATAAPAAYVLRGRLQSHLGASLSAAPATYEWNEGWATEFSQQSQGIGRTFTHEILGFGGTLATLSAFADQTAQNPAVAATIGGYIVLWVFLSGGVLDRLARGRPTRASGFFSACGAYFWRFLRLGLIVAPVYWALFRWLHPYLLVTLYDRFSRDMTSERSGMALRAGLYLAFFSALVVVNVIADYAKVRAVVEDRRSAIGALGASWRFVRRRPLRVIGVYLLNVLALAVVIRLWMDMAPSTWASVWWALLVTQIYLLARLLNKLAFMASEAVFFQGELAHAGYTAGPPRVWPESPAAEAVANLVKTSGSFIPKNGNK